MEGNKEGERKYEVRNYYQSGKEHRGNRHDGGTRILDTVQGYSAAADAAAAAVAVVGSVFLVHRTDLSWENKERISLTWEQHRLAAYGAFFQERLV